MTVDVADREFLSQHFTGNLSQALEYVPGVRSMDIGSGFSKPMIRGMGFNRITVTENGIKQEGQQWGSDHGLEIDAFNVERVIVRKGSASLLYGSDAMGGVIEIMPLPWPSENMIYGEVSALGKSVNGNIGGSVMLGVRRNRWHAKVRYSEQHYGDYRVPTDSIVYLTQRIPIYGSRMKNTAGYERNVNALAEYRYGRYSSSYSFSNAFQKSGFFPGAHGIPDANRVQDDGDRRNIELPYSKVNHMKLSTRQQYAWSALNVSWDLGYQNNLREEWSEFHTHYGTQSPPETNPDKELEFRLHTVSSSVKVRSARVGNWTWSAGWDVQWQHNDIGGYSFLLPRYDRFSTGVSGVAEWHPSKEFCLNGGLRYDYGKINVSSFTDEYLEAYLQGMGYDSSLIESYKTRSYAVNRRFDDLSGAIGIVWTPDRDNTLKLNLGHSFRLPSANELASNGVHHGTFRHEQGDPTLSSERGWQIDALYQYDNGRISLSVTPFASYYTNYIYLRPTGEWSVLPHAGQIYRYTGADVIFAGSEVSFGAYITGWLNYSVTGEYVYTYNRDDKTALSFSPPASLRNTLTFSGDWFRVYAETHTIARQNRVARNESPTASATLFNIGASANIALLGTDIEIALSVNNLFNRRYYNHLSYYRQVEIPEPGRNFQFSINIPFEIKLR